MLEAGLVLLMGTLPRAMTSTLYEVYETNTEQTMKA